MLLLSCDLTVAIQKRETAMLEIVFQRRAPINYKKQCLYCGHNLWLNTSQDFYCLYIVGNGPANTELIGPANLLNEQKTNCDGI